MRGAAHGARRVMSGGLPGDWERVGGGAWRGALSLRIISGGRSGEWGRRAASPPPLAFRLLRLSSCLSVTSAVSCGGLGANNLIHR